VSGVDLLKTCTELGAVGRVKTIGYDVGEEKVWSAAFSGDVFERDTL
jgi:hypothetical protein